MNFMPAMCQIRIRFLRIWNEIGSCAPLDQSFPTRRISRFFDAEGQETMSNCVKTFRHSRSSTMPGMMMERKPQLVRNNRICRDPVGESRTL